MQISPHLNVSNKYSKRDTGKHVCCDKYIKTQVEKNSKWFIFVHSNSKEYVS